MTYTARLQEALRTMAADRHHPIRSVHWLAVPSNAEDKLYPMLVWARVAGGSLEGVRHDVNRPFVRLSVIGEFDGEGVTDFDCTEALRSAVMRGARPVALRDVEDPPPEGVPVEGLPGLESPVGPVGAAALPDRGDGAQEGVQRLLRGEAGAMGPPVVEESRRYALNRGADGKLLGRLGRLLAEWPEQPADVYDDRLSRPRIDWFISLRGE